jgi:hypothetical protein
MRAHTLLASALVVVLAPTTAHAGLFSFGAAYRSAGGNEPGPSDPNAMPGMVVDPVAYPFSQTGFDIVFEAEVDDLVETSQGKWLGLRMGGGLTYITDHERTDAMGTAKVEDAQAFDIVISGGTLLPIVQRGAVRLDGHVSVDLHLILPLAVVAGVRLRNINGRSVQRVQYDVRPFWVDANRLEHQLTVSAAVGGVGVRGQVTLGDNRTVDGGYRYHAFTLGLEVVR